MKSATILIHTHFHRKRTGVTRSIENVFPHFAKRYNAYVYGYGVAGKKISTQELLKAVFSQKSVVIHCHRNIEIIFVLILRLLGGRFKLIATRHAETTPSITTDILLKKADTVVAITNNMARQLSYPSVVIGHGVDQKIFKIRRNVSLDEIAQSNIVSCVGRVRKAKGQKFLLEVAAPLLKKYKDWALVIIGKVDDTNFKRELERVISANSVQKQVYFIPETTDIVTFYQASHTVVVPSFTEGFSLVCAEAMLCGCNVLASRNVGVHSDIISEGKTGYLFDIKEKTELQNLLIELFEGRLDHLGDSAHKEISENWSSEIEAKKLMDLYAS